MNLNGSSTNRIRGWRDKKQINAYKYFSLI